MVLPNFIIIGAPRSGTTSLYNYLKEHPEIFMCPIKEPNFFSINSKNYSLETYQNLFSKVKDEKAIGEASPSYLRYKEAPIRIKQLIPECKIMMILRSPVERLYSSFNYSKYQGLNEGTFIDFITKEFNEQDEFWYSFSQMIKKGLYCNPVKRYREIFGADKVKIFYYDELAIDRLKLVKDACDFLEVNSSFTHNLKKKYNISGIPIFPAFSRFMAKPNIIKNVLKYIVPKTHREKLKKGIMKLNMKLEKNRISENAKKHLLDVYYYGDIKNLEIILNKDLSAWLK